jgi:hypothetical protein
MDARQISQELSKGTERRQREIDTHEEFWRDHQPWLKQQGYMLRPRFAPDWVPSWKDNQKYRFDCEDGQPLSVCRKKHMTVVISDLLIEQPCL